MAIDMEDIEEPPPSEDAGVAQMKALVERFVDEGEIKRSETARLLQTHLTAVGRTKTRERWIKQFSI